jgi:hypothetical protein
MTFGLVGVLAANSCAVFLAGDTLFVPDEVFPAA